MEEWRGERRPSWNVHARSNWFSFHDERKRIDDDEGKKLKEGFERLVQCVLLPLFFFFF